MVLAALPVLLWLAAGSAPQHFVFFGLERERIRDPEFLSCPAIVGAQLKYTWKELEPERDRYELQPILDDLAFLQRSGKKLWVQLQDVSFDDQVLVPDYLRTDPAFGGGAAQKYETAGSGERAEGWVARRWDASVQRRFKKLLTEMAKKLDGRIEGINLPETSVDFGELPEHQPAGFSPARYAESVRATMGGAREAFRKSRVVQYANFMPGEWLPWEDHGHLKSVYAHAEGIGVGVGGPDVLPFRRGQQDHSLARIAARRAGVIAALAVQDGNLDDIDPKTKRRITVEQLLRYARETLHVDYLFWGTQEPHYSEQVLPLLRGLPRPAESKGGP